MENAILWVQKMNNIRNRATEIVNEQVIYTLEDHRDLPIDIQARHMKMLKCVDDIIIGNAFASEEELKIVQKVMSTSVDYLHVTFNEDASEQEKQMVCTIHDYRGDASEYMIRSSHHKQKYAKESILAHQHIK